MAIGRRAVNMVRYVLEDLLPPALRDSPLFLPLMYLAYGRNTRRILAFRRDVRTMSAEDYAWHYRTVRPIMGATDLNGACIARIREDATGGSVLDAGCGRGFLVERLARDAPERRCVGLDMVAPEVPPGLANLSYVSGWTERLPFADAAFDTVVCTHALEHILDLAGALAELRRVARRRLILVVPREREYRYNFNLHVHFFPYAHSFLNRIAAPEGRHRCAVLGGDIYYVEEKGSKASSTASGGASGSG